MFPFVICFLFGDLFLQMLPHLPSTIFIFILSGVCLAFNKLIKTLPLAFALGFLWANWSAVSVLDWQLPNASEGKMVMIEGVVASLPESDVRQTKFIFKYHGTFVRLSWRNPSQTINVGDEWRISVKLKRIHGTQNPGGFDFEAWALQKGLRATGYVIPNKNNQLISRAWYRFPVDSLRQRLQKAIQILAPQSATAPWLSALIVGERNGIASSDWQVLRNTGTNHLMAIAGLHIGLIAGFTHFLFAFIWRRIPWLVLRFPAQLAGASAAWVVACTYSALAGFSLPTQRACIMLSVFVMALLLRRRINPWHAWSLALLFVLVLNPLSVLSDSFWLSFVTIALIIYGMSYRLAPSGFWWKWGRVQWVIGFGLIPLTLALFQECSLISFIANCIAIPWLGFLILPLCFLSGLLLLLLPSVGGLLLLLADKSLSGLWALLKWFSSLDMAIWHHAMPSYGVLSITVIGVILLMLPIGSPGRWLGLVWWLPLILYQSPRPHIGDYRLTLLDVGQGLSVVIQTHKHTLVFDTGPKLSDNFDMGESVVLPYLRTLGINKIDMLVISHGDNDHIGGAQALIKAMTILSIQSSTPEKLPSKVTHTCLAGEAWEWDKIKFTVLHPSLTDKLSGNDRSCVIRVDNGFHSVLLTGDVEKKAEKQIISTYKDKIQSDILIAPHHGSKTSALKEFVMAVHPKYVLYAVGYRNRYHFPHAKVVDIYTMIGSNQYNTVESGAITFTISHDNGIFQPEHYRKTFIRYWFD